MGSEQWNYQQTDCRFVTPIIKDTNDKWQISTSHLNYHRDATQGGHCRYSMSKAGNWVFPKWISLNSANSVNCDKIQNWYGYQRYYASGNKYITSASNIYKVHFLYYLWVGIYCHSPLWTDTNQQIVVENSFYTTTSRNVSIVRYSMSSLVTILLLDFVMIHWISWIQRKSFRENSNIILSYA